MSYSGIFLRHYMGQQPGTTGGTAWSSSPDIIPYGQSPAQDPSAFINQDYDKSFDSNVYINDYNYVYIRGINTASTDVESRLWFYYTESDLALWPQNWRKDNILVAGNQQNYVEVKAAAGAKVVTPVPLQWKALPFSGSGGDHYCMAAFADNSPLSSPPVEPLPSQHFSSYDELAQYILATPNMAWRNLSSVAGAGATWQTVTPVTGATGGGQINIGVQLHDIPTDCSFSFNVPGPDAANSIVINKTTVVNPNQNFSVQVNWPEKFKSAVTISFWQGSTPVPSSATIIPTIATPLGDVVRRMDKTFLKRLSPLSSINIYDTHLFSSPAMESSSITRMVLTGAYTYHF